MFQVLCYLHCDVKPMPDPIMENWKADDPPAGPETGVFEIAQHKITRLKIKKTQESTPIILGEHNFTTVVSLLGGSKTVLNFQVQE